MSGRPPASLRLVKARINSRAGGISSLRPFFELFGNGDKIDMRGFKDVLHEDGIDIPATEVSNLFDYIDTDHSGKLSFQEFSDAIDDSYNNPVAREDPEDKIYVDPCFSASLVLKSAAALRVALKRYMAQGSNAVKAFKTFVSRKGKSEQNCQIMLHQFKVGMRAFNIRATDKAAQDLFKEIDSQNDGYIDFGEFATAFFGIDAKKSLSRATDWVRQNKQAVARKRQEAQMKAMQDMVRDPFSILKRKIQTGKGGTNLQIAFRRFKSTLCGKQDAVELIGFKRALKALEIEISDAQAIETFKKIDTDGTGTIDYLEFRDAMYGKQNMVRDTTDWTIKRAKEREAKVAMYTDAANRIRDPTRLYTVLRDMFLGKRKPRDAFIKFMRKSGSTDALIDLQEMKKALRINGLRTDIGVVERLFDHLDPNGDGQLTSTEFAKAFFDDDMSKLKDLNVPPFRRQKKQRNATPGKLTLDPLPRDAPAVSALKMQLRQLPPVQVLDEFSQRKTGAFAARTRDAVDLRGLRDSFLQLGVDCPIHVLKQLFYDVDTNNRGFITFKQLAEAVGLDMASVVRRKRRAMKKSKKFPNLVPPAYQAFKARRAATPQVPESPTKYFKRQMSDGMQAAFFNEARRRKLVAAARARAKRASF